MAVARAASPAVNPVSTVNEGPQPGDRIRVQWSAFSPADLVGVVVEAHPRTLAVAWALPGQAARVSFTFARAWTGWIGMVSASGTTSDARRRSRPSSPLRGLQRG